MALPGNELENDPRENLCFGCGPRNPNGLHLRFFDDGESVRAELHSRPDWVGWPGMWNLGLAFTLAVEAGSWALWERLGPARLDGPMSVEGLGAIRLSDPIVAEARMAERGPGHRIMVTVSQGGAAVLRLTIPVAALTAAEAETRLRVDTGIPAAMRPTFVARARGQ
jgi:hypothetical protein